MHKKSAKIKKIPLPGIEPGSPGWKPDILTAGRQRIAVAKWCLQTILKEFTLISRWERYKFCHELGSNVVVDTRTTF